MFAGKKSAQIREILINESAWEDMTCLFAPSLEEKVIETLRINSSKHKTDYVWMDTREIANASEINIYTSRYILLKLKKKGLVLQEVVKGKPYLWSLKLKERAF